MTVHTTSSSAGPFSGNGVSTTFPFTFTVHDDDHLVVKLTPSGWTETTLTQGTHYTVTLNSDQDDNPGGSIEFPGIDNNPMPTGDTLLIERVVDLLQETDLQNQGGYYPEVVESALDKLTMMIQQLQEELVSLPTPSGGDPLKIAVLNASESIIPYGHTFTDNLQKLFDSIGMNVNVYNTGYAGMSIYQARTNSDTYDNLTPVQRTINSDPDIVLMPHAITDAILKIDGRDINQVQADATALYNDLRAGTSAYLVYNRMTPYDHETYSATAVSSIKRKYCAPWMHETSTVTGDTGLYTSEEAHIGTILSTAMQTLLDDWRTLNTHLEGLADGTVETSYFRAMRLGFVAHDRLHATGNGQWVYTSKIWDYFLTNTAIRAAVPKLTLMHMLNNINLYEDVWRSLMIGDGSGGYKFDPTFADGSEGKEWPDDITTQELVRGIAYWGNEQRPQVNHTRYIKLSLNEDFTMTIDGLWPGLEIRTKIWLSTDPEPIVWSQFPDPRFTNIDGGYGNITMAATVASLFGTPGTYNFKFTIGNDAFGPFPVKVTA
ncbi:MAG: hypothetical protein DBP02_19835 [gamma proteobacterium symbiont of Ctena orbiculata]|nr:MAG: hypothetical protein DBP02_19835 [gamma proteobacterium symbiont of Ctena orbiculata]